MPALNADLRRIVRGVMANEGRHHAIQPAAVVNEAFVGLVQSRCRAALPDSTAEVDWQCRAHFRALAARQMRPVLGDYSRRHSRAGQCLTIACAFPAPNPVSMDVAIHDFTAVDGILAAWTHRHAVIVRFLEMDCFGGMSDREIALVERVSPVEARREREFARDRLEEALSLVPEKADLAKSRKDNSN